MTVEQLLTRFDEPVASLALLARELIFKELEDVEETVDNSAQLIGYGYGPGYKGNVCSILLSKKGVKLAFNRGSELPDPAQLLTGSGKLHRYVVINNEKDLRSAALKQLLKEGKIACKKRQEEVKSETGSNNYQISNLKLRTLNIKHTNHGYKILPHHPLCA